jgi:peptidoglycan-associated lipoprotein
MGLTQTTALVHDFYLDMIPEGEIEIKGIEYDFDSANLREQSKKELDKLLEFLNLNSGISIEIRSHTDIRGNDDYNQILSDARAKSVVDYLILNGISKDRLRPKGYGETTPAEVQKEDGTMVSLTPEYINSLATEDEQEEAHQRNRRTAFKVLSQED